MTNSTNNNSVLITGCSSGIGLSTAKLLHEHNWCVYATARKDENFGTYKRTLAVGVCLLVFIKKETFQVHTAPFGKRMKSKDRANREGPRR